MSTALILDKETNFVLLSKYITSYKVWSQLSDELERHNVFYGFLSNTKDIWVRDFMPLQTYNGYCSYVYGPDYLMKDPELRTFISRVRDCMPSFLTCDFVPFPPILQNLCLVLDGGNLIKTDKHLIMTDKVFEENKKSSREMITELLKQTLGVTPVYIPWDKSEPYGHADGMVRYVGDDTVLITNYCDFDPSFRTKLIKSLSPFFDIKELHYEVDKSNKNNWAYINFLQVDNCIFMPAMGIPEDEQAQRQLSDIYKCEVVPIRCEQLIRRGGALNCISWNIKYDKGFHYCANDFGAKDALQLPASSDLLSI